MGSQNIMYSIETDRPPQRVYEAARQSLMMLGGMQYDQNGTIFIKQGVNGVSMAFVANVEAMIQMRQTSPTRYEFVGTVNWSPNSTFWVCLILGFFMFIPWIFNVLYLAMNPTEAYQQALFRVQTLL